MKKKAKIVKKPKKAVKKTVKKKPTKAGKKPTFAKAMAGKKEKVIGVVIHFYDKAMVAVVKLHAPIKLGDTVKFRKGAAEFLQKVASMQIDHVPIKIGKKGHEVAIKIKKVAKQGAKLLKI